MSRRRAGTPHIHCDRPIRPVQGPIKADTFASDPSVTAKGEDVVRPKVKTIVAPPAQWRPRPEPGQSSDASCGSADGCDLSDTPPS